MRKKFKETLENYKMIEPGDGVVLGVSGGPDSMAMLALFQEMSHEWQLKLHVVHLNHGFRGQAADEDEAYVVDYCHRHGLPCYTFKRDVALEAKVKGLSFEEAGRLARYELFQQVMKKTNSCRVAVAHNQNDQAETLLMRLMRGTGPEGLSAIPPVRDAIIRPLIHISRQEIEAFCEVENLEARIDHTNSESIYHRNSIRLTLIPLIEKLYNPALVQRLSVTADLLRDENAYMDKMADLALAEICDDVTSPYTFELTAFNPLPSAIKRRVIRKLVQLAGASTKNLSAEQVESLIKTLERGRHGNQKQLNGVVFSVSYSKITVTLAKLPSDDEKVYEIVVKIVDKSEWQGDKSGINTLWMDEQSISGKLVVRYRQDGDRFTPFGMVGSKKLKDFMIDEKIPQGERSRIPLLCDEKGILWVYGYRASNRCKVDFNTQKVAKIELIGKNESSR